MKKCDPAEHQRGIVLNMFDFKLKPTVSYDFSDLRESSKTFGSNLGEKERGTFWRGENKRRRVSGRRF